MLLESDIVESSLNMLGIPRSKARTDLQVNKSGTQKINLRTIWSSTEYNICIKSLTEIQNIAIRTNSHRLSIVTNCTCDNNSLPTHGWKLGQDKVGLLRIEGTPEKLSTYHLLENDSPLFVPHLSVDDMVAIVRPKSTSRSCSTLFLGFLWYTTMTWVLGLLPH